jgi:mono/diheme cytochrome c family protein
LEGSNHPGRIGKKAALLLLLAGAAVTAVFATSASRQAHSRRQAKPALAATAFIAKPTPARLAQGRYLVETVSGCFDCHSVHEYVNGQWIPKKGMKGAGNVFPPGFVELPPGAQVVAPNITPDKETGIGTWTKKQIVTALQTGVRPDGRILAPIMPWHAFAHLNKRDANAIADYLKTLKPVSHKVPGPFGPGEKVTTFMFRILPPGQTAADAPKPPAKPMEAPKK